MAFQRKALHNRAFQRKALHSHRCSDATERKRYTVIDVPDAWGLSEPPWSLSETAIGQPSPKVSSSGSVFLGESKVARRAVLFRCCFVVVSLLFRCCFVVVSLLFRCCVVVVSLLFRCCFVVASLLLRYSVVSLLYVFSNVFLSRFTKQDKSKISRR